MNKLYIGGVWIISLLLAYFLGLQSTDSGQGATQTVSVQSTAETQPIEQVNKEEIGIESSNKSTAKAVKEVQPTTSITPEETARHQQQQRLTLDKFLDAMLNQNQAKSHQETRSEFQEEYDEHAQNYERKTQVTDFLQLHKHAEKIMLHELKCEPTRCLLVGSFDGQHESWADIVEDMKNQDWWNFGGTSSSSNSDGSVTHFMLFMDK